MDETLPRRQPPGGRSRAQAREKERRNSFRRPVSLNAYEGDTERRISFVVLGPSRPLDPERTCFPISPETISFDWRRGGFGCVGPAPRTLSRYNVIAAAGRSRATPRAFPIPILPAPPSASSTRRARATARAAT